MKNLFYFSLKYQELDQGPFSNWSVIVGSGGILIISNMKYSDKVGKNKKSYTFSIKYVRSQAAEGTVKSDVQQNLSTQQKNGIQPWWLGGRALAS